MSATLKEEERANSAKFAVKMEKKLPANSDQECQILESLKPL